jgi:hypothetical protein
MFNRICAVALLALPIGGCVPRGEPATAGQTSSLPADSKIASVGKETGRIVSQPARDVGASKIKVPPILEQAETDPYTIARTQNCATITAELTELDVALGPDFVAGGEEKKENKAGKLAAAGGQTVVNALIPFRGLVREISGAAPAQRRLNDAVDAGNARRGFLRGLMVSKGCRTPE